MVLFMLATLLECVLVMIATVISMHLHETERKANNKKQNDEIEESRKEGDAAGKQIDEMMSALRKVDLAKDGEKRHEEEYIKRNTTDAGGVGTPCSHGKAQSNHLVGTESRTRRVVKKLSRFLAKDRNLRKSGRFSAKTWDKIFFAFFFLCSSLFHFTIFHGA